jgi:hypothetical protein
MSTPKIPCQAKNPERCRYHGAILRSERALHAGNMDAYLTAQTEVTEAAKDSKEVREFFARTGNLKLDHHGDAVPDIDKKTALSIITNMYKGHRIPYRDDTANKVMDIMNEPNQGMHPWHDKYDRVRKVLSDDYDEVDRNHTRAQIATDRIFLANGLIVTTTYQGSLKIMDERSAVKNDLQADQVQVGDVVQLSTNRYEVTEIDYSDEADRGILKFTLYGGLVDRKTYQHRAFVYEAPPRMNIPVLQ